MKLRLDIADAHAALAVLMGVSASLITVTILLNYRMPDRWVAAYVVCILLAGWTGVFAMVLRGTWFTRFVALFGLSLALFSICGGGCGAILR